MTSRQHIPEIPEWIISKMKHFCAFQERSISEVKAKLKTFHLQEEVYDAVINHLIEKDFLNEERFAKSFARGKFRINKWGKNKIYLALQEKNVPELFILEGLNEIEPAEYLSTLKHLIAKKNQELQEHDVERRNKKLANFAIARGFEANLVWDILSYRE